MTSYLLKRLGQIFITLILFLTLTFFLIQAQPGNFADAYALNPNFPPEARLELQEKFGLSKPIWQQYFIYVGNFFRGDFGFSFELYPRSVVDIIKERLPRTIMLFVTAAVVSFYMGFTLGKIIAWKRGTITEYASTLGGVTLYTVFTPRFALMMIWLFAFKAGWFPLGKFLDPLVWSDAPVDANHVFNRMIVTGVSVAIVLLAVSIAAAKMRLKSHGMVFPAAAAVAVGVTVLVWSFSSIGGLAFDIVKHMVLPVLTLTLISFAGTMLLTRNSMLETMSEDFVLAARAKGLPERVIRDKHVARNAMLPVVTSFVFSLAFAIDGGVIIESVFSWPGMGMTLVNASLAEDLPLAVGAFVFTGIFALFAHLVADVLHTMLDPRITH